MGFETDLHLMMKEKGRKFLEKKYPEHTIYEEVKIIPRRRFDGEYIYIPRVDLAVVRNRKIVAVMEVGDCYLDKLEYLKELVPIVYHWPYGRKLPYKVHGNSS